MNLVNKNTIDIQDISADKDDIVKPVFDNSLLLNFQTQLVDWKKQLSVGVNEVDNKCVLIFEALFIIELWIKFQIIRKFSLMSFDHRIENCELRLYGHNCFSLDKVNHNIGQTLQALINCSAFKEERNILKLVLEHCDIISQEAHLPSLDKYSDLKYNYKIDKQFVTDVMVDTNLKGEIKKLIAYANY